MTYVDPLMNHGWRLGRSCHLTADTLEELHSMAKRIGMKPEWFQGARMPHYDLTEKRRAHAVRLGAKEITVREMAGHIIAWRRLSGNRLPKPAGQA